MGAAGEISDQQKQVLGTIKDNVARLTTLVEDVLKISKIDAGRETLQLEEINLNAVVSQALKELQADERNQTKDLTVNFEVDNDLSPIEADHEKLEKVIYNVLDNAFNYTRDGGAINVEINPDDSAQYLVTKVQDSGVGIPEDFRDRVWLRFERHDETALDLDVAGTGLGLPIVKELVEMHGGEVWFDSVEDEGTTFFIKLPIKHPYYVSQLGSVVHTNGSGLRPMASILVAEDERDIRDLIRFTLTFAGHEVTPVRNGEEAVASAQEIKPDLIMLDVRMPKLTGYEACKQIKSIEAIKDIPVVFLSAKGQDDEISTGIAAGAIDYILKPFAPGDLTERVSQILNNIGIQ